MNSQTLLMHQLMLSDRVRRDAYDRALQRTIRRGDVVVDVGAGTLLLSLGALHYGASHVYAIEADPELAALGRRIAERNRLHGRLTLIQGDARTVQLPEKADVIVCELMGNLGPEEEMAEIVAAVAGRNLKPGGLVIPERIETWLQAVQLDAESWGIWSDDFWGYSLDVVRDYANPSAQLHFFHQPPTALSAATLVAAEDLGRRPDGVRSGVDLDIVSEGTLHAVVGHFTATLAEGVTLSNFPSYPGCNWAVWLWPLRPTTVRPGARVEVRLVRPEDVRIATEWQLECRIARSPRRAAA